MKETYEKLDMKIITFESFDIITDSSGWIDDNSYASSSSSDDGWFDDNSHG